MGSVHRLGLTYWMSFHHGMWSPLLVVWSVTTLPFLFVVGFTGHSIIHPHRHVSDTRAFFFVMRLASHRVVHRHVSGTRACPLYLLVFATVAGVMTVNATNWKEKLVLFEILWMPADYRKTIGWRSGSQRSLVQLHQMAYLERKGLLKISSLKHTTPFQGKRYEIGYWKVKVEKWIFLSPLWRPPRADFSEKEDF